MKLILSVSLFLAIYTPKLAIISEIHHSAHRESLTKKNLHHQCISLFCHGQLFFFYHGLNGFNGLDGFLRCVSGSKTKTGKTPW